jgi:excisionase family DNA binding protein
VEKLLLSPSEVAATLGIGRQKLYAMLSSRQLNSVRIGRSIRVPVGELKAWLEAQTEGTTEPILPDGVTE